MARPHDRSSALDDEDWNIDVVEDLEAPAFEQLQLFSRDWTVETIASQIEQRNIDLDPDFQRRNVWTDERRSKLIESLVVGIPVPQIFLAERAKRKRSFIVIDGKQRLLTIAGFLNPSHEYWNDARLVKLTIRKDLNGMSFQDMCADVTFRKEVRHLRNADIRCAVISNYDEDDVLYHIFNRLNTTSVPLSTQELRQVLHRGPFSDFLAKYTDRPLPLHGVMGLQGPDKRLRDTELVLRFLAVYMFADAYTGNLKQFLDKTMDVLNRGWSTWEPKVRRALADLEKAIKLLEVTMRKEHVGRKVTDAQWEGRFNKVLFEVEAYYFTKVPRAKVTAASKSKFIRGFERLCDTDSDFRDSIEATTKTVDRYATRFEAFMQLVNRSFQLRLRDNPFR